MISGWTSDDFWRLVQVYQDRCRRFLNVYSLKVEFLIRLLTRLNNTSIDKLPRTPLGPYSLVYSWFFCFFRKPSAETRATTTQSTLITSLAIWRRPWPMSPRKSYKTHDSSNREKYPIRVFLYIFITNLTGKDWLRVKSKQINHPNYWTHNVFY